ncbi:hypothetical protein [Campylobacter showae]|uniref:hypothetical protein n=1 Tax=Campylobacter showae TaxID=204 RepID=UPI0026EC2FE0|nr:hypothetical protein [Campylobacter showae]
MKLDFGAANQAQTANSNIRQVNLFDFSTNLRAKFDATKCKFSTLSQRNLLKFSEIKNSPKPNLSAN